MQSCFLKLNTDAQLYRLDDAYPVFYVIAGKEAHCNTFHGILTATFRPDPNERGSAAGLTHKLQNQR